MWNLSNNQCWPVQSNCYYWFWPKDTEPDMADLKMFLTTIYCSGSDYDYCKDTEIGQFKDYVTVSFRDINERYLKDDQAGITLCVWPEQVIVCEIFGIGANRDYKTYVFDLDEFEKLYFCSEKTDDAED